MGITGLSTVQKAIFLVISLALLVVSGIFSVRSSSLGYVLPFGWKVSGTIPAGSAICDRALIERGFPFTFFMPHDDANDCNDQFNAVALGLNGTIAIILSVTFGWYVVATARKIKK